LKVSHCCYLPPHPTSNPKCTQKQDDLCNDYTKSYEFSSLLFHGCVKEEKNVTAGKKEKKFGEFIG
jgi:hypothetical protein